MRRLLGLVISGALLAGSAGTALAQQSTNDNSVKRTTKEAAHDTKKAAKATGKAVKRGTKKGINKTAEVTRKGANKVEKKTENNKK